jgi:mono/diheme cytochrome c family protein
MNYLVLAPIIAVLIALRFTRMNILGWLVIWWIASYVALSYGIEPPLPSSIIGMFMGIVTLALLAYLTVRTQDLEFVKGVIIRFLVDKKFTLPMAITVIALPLLVAFKIYLDASKAPQPPVSSRTIHPPPPTDITFKGKKIDLVDGVNPYRELQASDPEAFQKHVENGRRVYYQNCVFCHGDNMAGDGIFAHGYDPIPANFQDPTTIAMMQETYLFWRVAKGAPGLPEESTPWSSAMPAWENFLSEEEIWDVVIFMYEFTGHKPRAKEEPH